MTRDPAAVQLETEQTEAPHPAVSLDLRIESITATVVNVPLVAPYVWATGHYRGASKVIVSVTTKDGVVGIGEAGHWRHARLIDEEVAPHLIGVSAYDLRTCWRRAVPPVESLRNTEVPDVLRAYGGVEMALWDIRAKAAGVPLYQLLGGAWRAEIPFTEYFSARLAANGTGGETSPADIAAYCARMVELYDSPFFEGKVGYSDLPTDVEIVREVRQAIGPERMLRLDANAAWRLSTARKALERMAEYDIANIEDPVSSFEAMAKLRSHSEVPFSTHAADLPRAIALGVPDSFVLNLTSLGGIERTIRFIAACEATGVDFSFYSGETGVGTAAYLHVGASEPHLHIPSQSLLRWYADDVIEGGPFQPSRGVIPVPDRPGLGVELDPAAMKRAQQRFRDEGPMDQLGLDSEGRFRSIPAY